MLQGSEEFSGLQRAGGSSWELDRALQKAAGEAVERIAAFPPLEQHLGEPRSAASLKDGTFLDPSLIRLRVAPSRPSREDQIRWVSGWNLLSETPVPSYVPAQLVYLPYIPNDGEKVWLQPTSNGLAAGRSLSHATWNAALELVERDALLRSWWGTSSPVRIENVPSEEALDRLIELTLRYKFDVDFFWLPSSGGVIVVACVLSDQTGVGPPTTLGFKTSHDLASAMRGAIEEAHQLRPWLRDLMEEAKEPPASLESINDRALWWLTSDAQDALGAWVETATSDDLPESTEDPSLGKLVRSLGADGHSLWSVPLTVPIRDYSAVRVVVPSLQPIYFAEDAEVLLETLNLDQVARHPLL